MIFSSRAHRLFILSILAAAFVCTSAQSQTRVPAPEGWIGTAASSGRLAAIKHPATLGAAEAVLVELSRAEVASYREGLVRRLENAGISVKSQDSTEIGGYPVLEIRMQSQLEGRSFEVLLLELPAARGALYVTAILRPDDENDLQSLEKGVLTFAAAALATQD